MCGENIDLWVDKSSAEKKKEAANNQTISALSFGTGHRIVFVVFVVFDSTWPSYVWRSHWNVSLIFLPFLLRSLVESKKRECCWHVFHENWHEYWFNAQEQSRNTITKLFVTFQQVFNQNWYSVRYTKCMRPNNNTQNHLHKKKTLHSHLMDWFRWINQFGFLLNNLLGFDKLVIQSFYLFTQFLAHRFMWFARLTEAFLLAHTS